MPAPILTEDQVEEAILAVQRQQEESLQCMALLREQHERWQNSVEQLLAQIRPEYTEVVADLKGEKSKAPTQSTPLEKSLETKPQVTRERPEISQDAMLAIDSTMMEAFQFQEKGPLKRVIGEILSDAAAKKMSTAELSGWELYRHQVKKMVDSKWFEWTAGAIILLNMITIGLETEVSLRSAEGVMIFTNLERVFLAIYTLELVVRFIAGGRASIRDPWWLLDFILVAVGVVALVIAPTLGSIAQQDFGGMESLLIMRGLRLLRLVRALRMISYFKVMWRLVYSLLTAGGTMLSTSVLLLLALFISGVIAVELITKDSDLKMNPITGPIVEIHFASLPTSILTLVQFVTLDSIAAVYFPLMQAKPELVFFFVPIGLVVSIGLMNLVTAVLVENALENAEQEKELERLQLKNKVKGALPAMVEIFRVLDKDHSGHISREEIEHVPLDILPGKLLESISISSMADLFELLDVDGTGSLTQGEFVEGLLNLALLDVPVWTLQSLRLLGSLRDAQTEMQEDIKSLKRRV